MSSLVLISQQEHMSGSNLLTDHYIHFQDYFCFTKHSRVSKAHCEAFWDLCFHHLATMRHCGRSLWRAALFLQRLLGEQTEHHLPGGGNSFHCAEQAKQTLQKVWSLQGSKGHGTLWSFHRSHQRCDTGNRQMKIRLRTWQWLDAFMESRKVWVNTEKCTNSSSSLRRVWHNQFI